MSSRNRYGYSWQLLWLHKPCNAPIMLTMTGRQQITNLARRVLMCCEAILKMLVEGGFPMPHAKGLNQLTH